ncbi:MAG TPA: hypothetical protein VGS06_37680 [Streptosporangiaceae bacterium]|nr:hypothetical protein [Streptosporangiaceae bacterium]
MTTRMIPATDAALGTCPRTSSPASSATAGSRLIRVPKALAVRRRRARNSRLNGTTGCSAARPSMMPSSGQVTRLRLGPAASMATVPATGMETASPLNPVTRSPTCWVSRI